ncbi:MAG: hypothetical protein EBX50_17555 [Chitinophagia bacterium]|nr:hypothetical protein [Chitinophagia bacterium]
MSSMSTNIDDIPDPVLYNSIHSTDLDSVSNHHSMIEAEKNIEENRNNIKSIDLQQKEINSNISSSISTDKQMIEQKDLIHNILSENNVLVFFIIIIASLHQTSEFIYKFIPFRFHNSIIVSIIKAILLFSIYIIIIHYVL